MPSTSAIIARTSTAVAVGSISWQDVPVVVEHVLGVVRSLHLCEPLVGVVAVGLADAARIVGVEEVHVDTDAVGLECSEELSCPSGLGVFDGVGLPGKPDGVDDHVVLGIAAGVAGGVS
jgi:hypothetical protein